MDDLRKKIDELTNLRDTLVQITNTVNLTDVFSIGYESVYTGKLRVIAKKHLQQNKENTLNFNNLSRESQRLAKEGPRTAKESRQLARQSQRLSRESQHLARESQRLSKESQRLSRESQHLARESQRLANESINTFKNQNKINARQSIDSIKILIDKIEIDINDSSIELKKLITMDEICKLCKTDDYIQLFLEKYLITGSRQTIDVELISLIIKSFCDWHYSGLQINPKSIEWVDCMVASDPLYLIHHDVVYTENNDGPCYHLPNSIADIITNYSKEYQRRLRIYNVNDQDFSALPQEQFGCIACCDFLNFFSPAIIKNYLTTFFKLLRPGGSIICTLNFAYIKTGLLVEENYFKYAANLIIQKLFKDFGFEINSIIDLTPNIVWECNFLITAQKSGVLATSKAHQVLGSIIEK
jgi:hypothetical protein